MSNCDKCWNRDICKYADQARAFENELDIWMSGEKSYKPEVVNVLIKCDQFKTDWALQNKTKKKE